MDIHYLGAELKRLLNDWLSLGPLLLVHQDFGIKGLRQDILAIYRDGAHGFLFSFEDEIAGIRSACSQRIQGGIGAPIQNESADGKYMAIFRSKGGGLVSGLERLG